MPRRDARVGAAVVRHFVAKDLGQAVVSFELLLGEPLKPLPAPQLRLPRQPLCSRRWGLGNLGPESARQGRGVLSLVLALLCVLGLFSPPGVHEPRDLGVEDAAADANGGGGVSRIVVVGSKL